MKILLKIAIITMLAACGADENEVKKEQASKRVSENHSVTFFGQSYLVQPGELFERKCSETLFSFLISAKSSCIAVENSRMESEWFYPAGEDSYSTYKLTTANETATFKGEINGSTMTDDSDGQLLQCYYYSGTSYTHDGSKTSFWGHAILTTQTDATGYEDLDANQVRYIGVDDDLCQ